MELISNNRHEDTGALIQTQGATDSKSLAVRQQYGNVAQLCQRFDITAQRYCAKNIEKAVRTGMPNFGLIVRTYGEDGVAGLINAHITDAIIRMGEERDIDPYDVDFIARAICESERFRSLTMASILRFFHLLKCGEFDIFGKVTPRKILEAFRKYAIEQQAKEYRIAYQIEQERREREMEEHRKNAVPWEVYAEQNGIDPTGGFMGHIARQAEKERTKAELSRLIIEVIQAFASILTFLKEYNDGAERKE